jgi:hypothetical protein
LKMKLQASEALHPKSLQSKTSFARKIESPIKPLWVLHGRQISSGGGPVGPAAACSALLLNADAVVFDGDCVPAPVVNDFPAGLK